LDLSSGLNFPIVKLINGSISFWQIFSKLWQENHISDNNVLIKVNDVKLVGIGPIKQDQGKLYDVVMAYFRVLLH
jgi:hypothetical protein